MRRGKPIRHSRRVFLRLHLDAGEGFALLLRLDDPNRLAIDVEQVVGVAVARFQAELPDRDTPPGVQVHRIAGLDVPARLDQGSVDLLAGAFFWCVEVDQG